MGESTLPLEKNGGTQNEKSEKDKNLITFRDV